MGDKRPSEEPTDYSKKRLKLNPGAAAASSEAKALLPLDPNGDCNPLLKDFLLTDADLGLVDVLSTDIALIVAGYVECDHDFVWQDIFEQANGNHFEAIKVHISDWQHGSFEDAEETKKYTLKVIRAHPWIICDSWAKCHLVGRVVPGAHWKQLDRGRSLAALPAPSLVWRFSTLVVDLYRDLDPNGDALLHSTCDTCPSNVHLETEYRIGNFLGQRGGKPERGKINKIGNAQLLPRWPLVNLMNAERFTEHPEEHYGSAKRHWRATAPSMMAVNLQRYPNSIPPAILDQFKRELYRLKMCAACLANNDWSPPNDLCLTDSGPLCRSHRSG